MSPAQALEVRMREVQAILETVQNQRNELKQLYKVLVRLKPRRRARDLPLLRGSPGVSWCCLRTLVNLMATTSGQLQ